MRMASIQLASFWYLAAAHIKSYSDDSSSVFEIISGSHWPRLQQIDTGFHNPQSHSCPTVPGRTPQVYTSGIENTRASSLLA